jgi:hypothetical protein
VIFPWNIHLVLEYQQVLRAVAVQKLRDLAARDLILFLFKPESRGECIEDSLIMLNASKPLGPSAQINLSIRGKQIP